MENIFCPFTSDNDCVENCVFNYAFYDENHPHNCSLVSMIQNLHSFYNSKTNPIELLKNIESNTSNNETTTSDILSTLNRIEAKLSNK